MTDKTKKVLIIAACAVVSIALIVGIVAKLGGSSGQADPAIKDDNPYSSPVVNIDTNSNAYGDKNSDSDPSVANPEKPTATPDFTPTQEQIESGAVPTGDHDSVTKPATTPAPVNNAGEVYIPGFGYGPTAAPGGTGHLSDMYENGNKVGTMD